MITKIHAIDCELERESIKSIIKQYYDKYITLYYKLVEEEELPDYAVAYVVLADIKSELRRRDFAYEVLTENTPFILLKKYDCYIFIQFIDYKFKIAVFELEEVNG